MLKAIIFDFNGVIVDDEPLHLMMFQKVLREEGWELTSEEYYGKYLPMDDRTLIISFLKDRRVSPDDSLITRLALRKAAYYREEIQSRCRLFPGVADFVARASRHFQLVVASGALREEIELVLERSGLRGHFSFIVSVEDVKRGKPAPDAYLAALEGLNRLGPGQAITADQCLVIEDAPAGIEAAHGAGMKCIAVANSYPAGRLSLADLVLETLEGYDPMVAEALFLDRGRDEH